MGVTVLLRRFADINTAKDINTSIFLVTMLILLLWGQSRQQVQCKKSHHHEEKPGVKNRKGWLKSKRRKSL